MTSTVVPGRLTVSTVWRETDFGFFFVPTFLGDTDASSVVVPSGLVFWAMAAPARTSEADAMTAPMSSLRKRGLLLGK